MSVDPDGKNKSSNSKKMSTPKVAVILQARTGSKRLPGKVLADLAGQPMLAFLVSRLKQCTSIDEYILATTNLEEDDELTILGKSLGLKVIRGSQNDVLSRYAKAAKSTEAEVLIRITGDCPLVDPSLLTEMIQEFRTMDIDYYSNCMKPTYPDGLDIEFYKKIILKRKLNALNRNNVNM